MSTTEESPPLFICWWSGDPTGEEGVVSSIVDTAHMLPGLLNAWPSHSTRTFTAVPRQNHFA